MQIFPRVVQSTSNGSF